MDNNISDNSEVKTKWKIPKPDIKKVLIIVLSIVVCAGIIYIVVHKGKEKKMEYDRAKRISESAAWLDTQVQADTTLKEKQAVGKALENQAKKTPVQTPEQKQKALDFLNS